MNEYDSQGFAFVLSAPSGTGKSTIIAKLLEARQDVTFSVSHTTREPREGERHGIEYYFVSGGEFAKMVEDDKFIEHSEIYDNSYGTSTSEIERITQSGKIALLDIEHFGYSNLKKIMGNNLVSIFLMPPNLESLEERLKSREDKDSSFQKRFDYAKKYIGFFEDYDYIVVNDDVEKAVLKIEKIIDSEKNKVIRLKNKKAIKKLFGLFD